MAPGFPMDGGRVLRSLIWGVSGNLYRATRLATLLGRGLGYALMGVGTLAFFGFYDIIEIDPWSGAWFVILGLFLESSARQAWLQAKALDVLSHYTAADVMSPELQTTAGDETVQSLVERGGKRFIFFVSGPDDRVAGVLTEKETDGLDRQRRSSSNASDVMVRTENAPTAAPGDNAANLIQAMEAAAVWHLPVVDEGRVVGVVSKESLLRLLARNLLPPRRPDLVGQR
jgi:CBS domain-containing protein